MRNVSNIIVEWSLRSNCFSRDQDEDSAETGRVPCLAYHLFVWSWEGHLNSLNSLPFLWNVEVGLDFCGSSESKLTLLCSCLSCVPILTEDGKAKGRDIISFGF